MKKISVAGIIFLIVLLVAIVLFGVFFTVDKVSVQFVNDVTVADKEEVLSAIDIQKYTNIFSVNEKKIKQEVETAFSGNTIEVVSVKRSFPNIVSVIVRERTPLFKIAVSGADTYAAADKDFRRNSVYTEDQLAGRKLIEVTGFEVTDSFAVPAGYQLRTVARTLEEKGFSDEGIVSFVTGAEFTDTSLTLTLFDGATITLDRENIASTLEAGLTSYLSVSAQARRGMNF